MTSLARNTRCRFDKVLLLDDSMERPKSPRACHIGNARAQNKCGFGDRVRLMKVMFGNNAAERPDTLVTSRDFVTPALLMDATTRLQDTTCVVEYWYLEPCFAYISLLHLTNMSCHAASCQGARPLFTHKSSVQTSGHRSHESRSCYESIPFFSLLGKQKPGS
jgi:hypothetical protein